MLQEIFQQEQQYHTGGTEDADHQCVEPVDAQRDANDAACKVQQEQYHEAYQCVDEHFARKANGGGEQLNEQEYCQNGNDENSNGFQNMYPSFPM